MIPVPRCDTAACQNPRTAPGIAYQRASAGPGLTATAEFRGGRNLLTAYGNHSDAPPGVAVADNSRSLSVAGSGAVCICMNDVRWPRQMWNVGLPSDGERVSSCRAAKIRATLLS